MPDLDVALIDRAGMSAIRVSQPDGRSVTIAHIGATLVSWVGRTSAGSAQLTDGYRSKDELVEQDGVRNGILAPFSNRITDGRYAFDGVTHDLLPGVAGANRLLYHGFARLMTFTLARVMHQPGRVVLTFRASIAPDDFPGYPFAVRLQVDYAISLDGIDLQIKATNIGTTAAPCGLGWHSYFCLPPADMSELVLRVPARKFVVTGGDLIPVQGHALTSVTEPSGIDLRAGRRLGDLEIDRCFTDLSADRGAEPVTTLIDPGSGDTLEVWQERGHLHVFTGDTLRLRPRHGLALEPVEFMTDAFNRPECAAQIMLHPGATRSFRCGVRLRLGDGREAST